MNIPNFDPKKAAEKFNQLPILKNPPSTGREISINNPSYWEDQEAERDFLRWEAKEQAREERQLRMEENDF